MRAVVQRVSRAKVSVSGKTVAAIERGLVVFLGVSFHDGEEDVSYMAHKITNLRIFEDAKGKMNVSLKDINGEILVISQFTLYGDCRKGRRPNFFDAASPEKAEPLYEKFLYLLQTTGLSVRAGVFGAEMLVEVANDGPVTLLLDSSRLF